MRVRTCAVAAAAVLAAGCAALPVAQDAPARGTAEACLPLYQEFDRLERLYPSGSRADVDRIDAPALERQGHRLLRADCIARNRHLDRMAMAPRVAVAESGPAVRRVSIHAGAVAGILEELRVRDYFAAQGVRVRSIGQPSLGRRIYLGPFATEGGLASAAEAARAAGFVAPYPTRF